MLVAALSAAGPADAAKRCRGFSFDGGVAVQGLTAYGGATCRTARAIAAQVGEIGKTTFVDGARREWRCVGTLIEDVGTSFRCTRKRQAIRYRLVS